MMSKTLCLRRKGEACNRNLLEWTCSIVSVSGKRGYEICYVVEVEVVVDLDVVGPVARSEQLLHLVTCCFDVVVTCYLVDVP